MLAPWSAGGPTKSAVSETHATFSQLLNSVGVEPPGASPGGHSLGVLRSLCAARAHCCALAPWQVVPEASARICFDRLTRLKTVLFITG